MNNMTETADLRAENAQLNTRLAENDKVIGELRNTVAELTVLVEHFRELFKLSQIKRYGSSSEQGTAGTEQLSITGNPAPGENSLLAANLNVSAEVASETETETVTITRKKKSKGKREDDLSKLPLEVIEHDLPEDERKCPDCGAEMTPIGVETRDEIKIIPAQVIHVQHRQKVYKCAECERTEETTPIVKADIAIPVDIGVFLRRNAPKAAPFRLESRQVKHGIAICRNR